MASLRKTFGPSMVVQVYNPSTRAAVARGIQAEGQGELISKAEKMGMGGIL